MPINQRNPEIIVFTYIASPYQVDLFNRVQALGGVNLSIVYETRSDKGDIARLWKSRELLHPHNFLNECTKQELLKSVLRADLVIFSGYRNPRLRALMSSREA